MKYSGADFWKIIVGMVIALVVLVTLLAFPVYYVKGTERQVDMHVVKTERVVDDGDSKYLIYSKEGTFQNTDSLLNGKFNSSDLYGRIENGKTYDCKVYGWRLPFFSKYPNIVDCEKK